MRRRWLLGAAATGVAAGAATPLMTTLSALAKSGGTVSTYAGRLEAEPFSGDGGTAAQAGLGEPVGLALASDGSVIVAERMLGAKWQDARAVIRRIDDTLRIVRVAGTGRPAYSTTPAGWRRTGPMFQGRATDLMLSLVGGVAVRNSSVLASLVDADGTGVIVEIDTATSSVSVVAGGGSNASNATSDGRAAAAQLYGPAGLSVLPNGDLLVAEFGTNRVRKVTTDGRIETIAGGNSLPTVPAPSLNKPLAVRLVEDAIGDGGQATKAVLLGPRDVTSDANGNVYVSEAVGHRVRRISPNGVITTVAGNGRAGFAGDGRAATAAQLYAPQGIAVNRAGDLFIADTFNNRVRVVSNGVITTVAGSGQRGYTGDGGPALSATFSRPGMLVLLAEDRLLVGDEGNRVVREVTLA